MPTASHHPAAQTRHRPVPSAVPADASLRWLTTASHFARTGGLLTVPDLAQRMHQRWVGCGFVPIDEDPVGALARWVLSGHVLSLDSPWGRLVPMFHFHQGTGVQHACMQRLLAVLRPVLDDHDTALWFVTPNHWINDQCPAVTMHENLPQALMAARLDRHIVCGDDGHQIAEERSNPGAFTRSSPAPLSESPEGR